MRLAERRITAFSGSSTESRRKKRRSEHLFSKAPKLFSADPSPDEKPSCRNFRQRPFPKRCTETRASLRPPFHPAAQGRKRETDTDDSSSMSVSHLFCGGPGRPRTYDNPVMSRGLYQLSYGSSSGKYAPILPVWQEKKPGIPRNSPHRRLLYPQSALKRKPPPPEGEGGVSPGENVFSGGITRAEKTLCRGDGRGKTDGRSPMSGRQVTRNTLSTREDMSRHAGRPEHSSDRKASPHHVLFTEPGSIRGDARRRGRIREPRDLRAHNRSSGSATRGACRT